MRDIPRRVAWRGTWLDLLRRLVLGGAVTVLLLRGAVELSADVALWSLGREYDARIVGQHGTDHTWDVTLVVEYTLAGGRVSRTEVPVAPLHAQKLRANGVRLTALDVGPWHRSAVQAMDAGRGGDAVLSWILFLVFVPVIGWALKVLWWRCLTEAHLVRSGRVASGRVIEKLPGTWSSRLRYEFRERDDPEAGAIQVAAPVSSAAIQAAEPGDPVTILHALWNPRIACAYEHALFASREHPVLAGAPVVPQSSS